MDAQLKRGLIDSCVLAALAKSDSYGYKLTQDIQEVLVVSESTLYPVLRRLELRDCLATYNAEHNGRLRKYYRITPEGIRRLNDFKPSWMEVKKAVDYILTEGKQ